MCSAESRLPIRKYRRVLAVRTRVNLRLIGWIDAQLNAKLTARKKIWMLPSDIIENLLIAASVADAEGFEKTRDCLLEILKMDLLELPFLPEEPSGLGDQNAIVSTQIRH